MHPHEGFHVSLLKLEVVLSLLGLGPLVRGVGRNDALVRLEGTDLEHEADPLDQLRLHEAEVVFLNLR